MPKYPDADPPLHILRTIARQLPDPRSRQEAESARFNVYTALEAQNADAVQSWLTALETSIVTGFSDDHPARDVAQTAITALRRLAMTIRPARKDRP
jgi:hypothetical protein